MVVIVQSLSHCVCLIFVVGWREEPGKSLQARRVSRLMDHGHGVALRVMGTPWGRVGVIHHGLK